MDTTSACLSCDYCTKFRPGRKPKNFAHPCLKGAPKAEDPLNPLEYRWPKTPFGLYNILRSVTPREIWKKYRGPKGYEYKCHYRPKPANTLGSRITNTPPPWKAVRRDVPPAIELQTLPPRITTVAIHGPGSLLRPFFPELPELPEISITSDTALRVMQQERARSLAATGNLNLGGSSYTVKKLSTLKAPEVSQELEELEPLRAMSLKEVTNVPFLINYTDAISEEEDG